MTDLFLKTWRGDAPWLPYLFRSIDKFCHGFRRLVVIAESDDYLPRLGLPMVFQQMDESGNGYLRQQAVKLYADRFTDAEHILHVDSDCVFVRSVAPHDFMQDSKPIWLITPWSELPPAAVSAWKPVMRKFSGVEPTHEKMRRHPQMFPRWLYAELRGFCIGKHGQTLWNYIMEQQGRAFSEFNVAGHFAYLHHREDFTFLDTTKDTFPPDYVKQFYSWDGVNDEVRAEIERLLA